MKFCLREFYHVPRAPLIQVTVLNSNPTLETNMFLLLHPPAPNIIKSLSSG